MATTMKSPLERVAGRPLRWLTRVGGGELVDKLGLRDATERALHSVGSAAGKLMSKTPKARRPSATSEPKTSELKPVVPPAGEPARLAPVPASGTFDLAPTEDQDMIRATARRFADEVMRPAAHAADQACAPDPNVLAAGHELALAALVVPEVFGGLAETRAAVTIALVAAWLERGDL